MVFAHPTALWLLALAVPLVVLHARRRMGLAAGQYAGVMAARLLAFACLIGALAEPIVGRVDATRYRVAVVDLSASIDDATLERTRMKLAARPREPGQSDDRRLVVFGREAAEQPYESAIAAVGGLTALRDTVEAGTPGSSLAAALELAGALIPEGGNGEIILFSDGLATDGDASAIAYRLAERGIGVSVEVEEKARADEIILRSVSLPPSGEIGATVDFELDIDASIAGPATLIFHDEGRGDEERIPLPLVAGRQSVTHPCPLEREGLLRYSVRVEGATDARADNNALPVAIWVEPPRRVHVVEEDGPSPAAGAFRSLLGPAADVRSVTPDSLSAVDAFDPLDLLVLADVPAGAIPADAQQRIKQAVVDGMGLLVTGGRRSFGPGGYARTPLADVLPVRVAQEVQRRDPSTTLVVIIDTSGSMGGARVNLAKEIARLAIARLKPHDKVGIVEFYGSKRWAAPIQPASNAIDLHRALNRLSAGGGTVILPAIEEAYYALQNVRTRTKHVLVLTDGGVETGAFEPLIRKMAEKGITLSTVMVGPGGHSTFLAGLAQWGRGRFYTAPDRFNLPEVIIKQPESSLLTPFVEQPTVLQAHAGRAVLNGIDFDSCPPLSGYVQTQLRPTADVLLTSSLGHPILARWRYGLGMVAAYTTQVSGEWSADLTRWKPYARVMSGLVRSLCPPRRDEALRVGPTLRPGAVEVQIDNRLVASGDAAAALELTVTSPDGVVERRVLDPLTPGSWNTRLTGLEPGVYRLDVQTAGEQLAGTAAFAVPPVREVTALEPDRDHLAEIEGFQTRAAQRALQRAGTPPRRPVEAWPLLAGSALVLLLLNVLLRRLPRRQRRSPARAAAIMAAVGVLSIWCPAARGLDEVGIEPEVARAVEKALSLEAWPQVESRFTLACDRVQRRDGDLGALVAYLQTRADAGPNGRRLLARAAAIDGRITLAAETLDTLRDACPDDPDYWGDAARLAEWSGDDEAAVRALDRAVALEPDPARRFALQIRRALILYDAAGGPAAAETLRDLAAGHAGAARVQSYCALLAGLNGDNETALALLRPQGSAKERFRGHLFRGLYASRLGRFGAALREYEQACSLAPLARDRRFALDRVVGAARESGELDELADRWLRRESAGERESAGSTEVLQALMAVLRELARPDDALALLRRDDLTEQQRQLVESPAFQSEVIATAVEAGRLSLAESAYRSLVAREPEHVEWRVGLARLLLLDGRRDEAARLFDEGIGRVDRARPLWGLADGARRLGLDDVALRASRKIGRCPGGQVRAVLFEADLFRERGDTDAAVALLKQLDGEAQTDPRVIMPVAEAFERYGDRSEALALFRRLYEVTQSEDVLTRVAWLLEEAGRYGEAYDLWLETWRTTQVAARMRQARQRVLDLASRTGRLADLAIALEEQLDEAPEERRAEADDRELALLVDIYTLANDPVSAAEILAQYRTGGGSDAESVALLKRLVQIHLNCEQFGRCNRLLRRLIDLDPDNADDYLQQIAVIALERRQPFQAKAALAEMAARGGPNGRREEFSAGVLDKVGLHGEAAQAYGRVLAGHPDRIEAFLTWGNAMRAAGRVEQAIGRFQRLLEEAEEDDLFAVAVDGLLNLDAPPFVLRSARRRVMTRIADQPDKVFLYRLGADLLDAMGKPEERDGLLEQAVLIAGERRGPLLRELMDSALAVHRTDRVISFGWSLLALDERMPPQVYLDLGEALVKTGRLAQAERVFARASASADFTAVQQRVATYYEEANRPEHADRIIRELLAAEPDNVPLLIRSGGLCEQLAAYDRAFDQYGRAADLMLRRLPRAVRRDEANAPEPATDAEPPRRRWRAANLDEVGQYFDSAAGGLLNAARTPAMREHLLSDIVARVNEEMDALSTTREWAATIADNVRLDRLARFLRHVAFSLHRPAVADEIDHQLAARYPADAVLLTTLLQDRLRWGLYASAVKFADPAEQAGAERPLVLPFILIAAGGASPADVFPDDDMAAGLASRYVPMLIMVGADEEARRVLRTASPGDPGETAGTMIAAAVALHDDEAMRRWATLWLDAAGRLDDAIAAADQVERCLRLTWNHLTPGDRAVLCQRVDRLAIERDDDHRVPLDLLRMRLADAIGSPFEECDRVLAEAASDDSLSVTTLASLLQRAAPEDRPGLVRRMTAARKPTRVRTFLMELVGALHAPADPPLVETIEQLFSAAPAAGFRADRAYSDVSRGAWNANPDQPKIGRRIGEILLSDTPSERAVLTAVAIARANANTYDDAMLLADEAVDLLLSVTEPETAEARMWDDLAGIMTPADRDELVADLDERIDIEGPTPSLHYARGVLLHRNNRRDEAIDAFTAAFRLSPDNRTLSRKVIRLLQQEGRQRDLARLLAGHLTKSSILQSFEWRTLVALYRDLYDLAAAAAAASRLEGPLSPIERMSIQRMTGRIREVRDSFLRFLITNRNQGRFYDPFWPDPPSPGGMLAYREKMKSRREDRPTMFTGVADLPFAADDFEALLRAAPPDRRDVPGLIDGLLAATRRGPGRDRLIAALEEARTHQAVTSKDRTLLFGLLRDAPDAVPTELGLELLWLPWVLDPADRNDRQTLWDLARIQRQAGLHKEARNILRWLTAYDLLAGPSTTQVEQRFRRLREYQATAPDREGQQDHAGWTRCMGLTPLDAVSGEFVAALIQRLAETGDDEGLAAQLELLDRRLRADPSLGSVALHAALARGAAALDRFDDFTAAIDAWCREADDHDGWTAVPLDASQVLPPLSSMNDPNRYLDAVVTALKSAAGRHLSPASAARGLCLLGQWCVDHERPVGADAALRAARSVSGSLGEHSLWIADLARATGHGAEADEIELDLLRLDRLPVPRVPRLLEAIEATAGRAAADELAVQVAAYSDHPQVLPRALRAAQSAGDTAAAADYERRLRAVTPTEP